MRNLNLLVQRGWDIFADKVRLDREFAVAAIDQYRELNALRPAEVMHCIERGPDSSSLNNTSSTSTMIRPSTSNGTSVGCTVTTPGGRYRRDAC